MWVMSWRVRRARHVARVGERELRTGVWWGNAKETLLGIPRRRGNDNIKMGPNELIWLRTGIVGGPL